jgi:hypothetical protein
MSISMPSPLVWAGIAIASVALVLLWSRRWRLSAGVLLILVVAAAGLWRAPAITHGLPYLSYIDEGEVVHRSATMLETPTPFPGWYRYPSTPMDGTAAFAALYAAAPGAKSVTPASDVRHSSYYDLGMPSALIVSGRLWILLLALATIAFIFATALLLYDTSAGVVAGLFAAAAPALAKRSAIVVVHTPAAAFVAAVVLTTVLALRRTRHARWWAFAAGCAAGAATTSVYVAGASIAIPLVAMLLERDAVTRERVRSWIATIGGFVLAVVVTMPAILVHPRHVYTDIRDQAHTYATRQGGSYLVGLTDTREFGPLLAIAAIIGLIVLLRRDQSRVLTIAWLSFAVLFLGFLERYRFQPAQTLLPIYPFLFVAAGVAVARGYRSLRALWPKWAAGATIAVVVTSVITVSLLSGTVANASDNVVDSRTQATDWLEHNAPRGADVVVAEELTILPTQLDRLAAHVDTVPANHLSDAVALLHPRYIVVGSRLSPIFNTVSTGTSELVAHFGQVPTPAVANHWRRNDEAISIYRVQ